MSRNPTEERVKDEGGNQRGPSAAPTGIPTFLEDTMLPTSIDKVMDDLKREELAKLDLANQTAGNGAVTINILGLGGFGPRALNSLGVTGDNQSYLAPLNSTGNTFVSTPRLKINVFHLDTKSPENDKYLKEIHPFFGDDFLFQELSDNPLGGDGPALLRIIQALDKSPDFREYVAKICDADLVIMVGSGAGTSTYGMFHHIVSNNLARHLAAVMVFPAHLATREIPKRNPGPYKFWQEAIKAIADHPQTASILPIQAETTVEGAEVGDRTVQPSIQASAEVAAQVIHSVFLAPHLYGGASPGHSVDLAQIRNPLKGKIGIPAFTRPGSSPQDTFRQLYQKQLAVGLRTREAMLALGRFATPSHGERLFEVIVEHELLGAVYNLDQEIPGGIIGIHIAKPEDAANLMDHLIP